jgi:hypothetical protein
VKTFKKDNNLYYKKRSRMLDNLEKAKEFTSKVRKEHVPAKADNEDEEEDDSRQIKMVGH